MIKADRDSFGFSNRSTKETGFFFISHTILSQIMDAGVMVQETINKERAIDTGTKKKRRKKKEKKKRRKKRV